MPLVIRVDDGALENHSQTRHRHKASRAPRKRMTYVFGERPQPTGDYHAAYHQEAQRVRENGQDARPEDGPGLVFWPGLHVETLRGDQRAQESEHKRFHGKHVNPLVHALLLVNTPRPDSPACSIT